MTYILMSHEASPAGFFLGGEFLLGKTQKKIIIKFQCNSYKGFFFNNYAKVAIFQQQKF
jgi:hypothetical protein